MLVASVYAAIGSPRLVRSPRSSPQCSMAVRSSASASAAPILTKLQKDCATSLPVLRHVADAMAADMRSGLAADGGGELKMILSYVDSLPSGYVVLDTVLLAVAALANTNGGHLLCDCLT